MQRKRESRPQDKKKTGEMEKRKKHVAGDSLACLVHDLKTPVITISGYAKRMCKGKIGAITEEQKEALDTIIRNCERLEDELRLILQCASSNNDLVDQFSLATFDIKTQLKKRIKSFRPLAKEKGVSLSIDVPSIPVEIQADRRMIDRAVSNLIDNAFKYTDPGGLISISLLSSENFVEITVSDNGKGLDKNEIGLIFKPFERSVSIKDREIRGVGLGLSNVKRYVELHQGEIRVESELGKGSSFSIRLPQRQEAET